MIKTSRPITLLASKIKRETLIIGGTVGIYFVDLADGEELQINKNTIFPSASVIKIPIMIQVMKSTKENLLNLHDTIDMDLSLPRYRQEEGSGILTHLESSVSLTVKDLLVLTVIESDNLATNCLMEIIGMNTINETMRQLGLEHTRVNRQIDDFDDLRQDDSNPTTPEEIATLLKKMYEGRLPCSDIMLDILKKQKYVSRIPFFLPKDDKDLEIAHKTGTLDGIVHDVGLVLHPCFHYVLVLMTKNQPEISMATLGIARISELIYDYMVTKHSEICKVRSE